MAQQLLKKVLIYEEEVKLLREEKEHLLDQKMKDLATFERQLQIMYSIASDVLQNE